MKRLYIYLFVLIAAMLFAACTEDIGFEGRNAATGKLRFVIPTWEDSEVETRAGVTSEDIGISEGSMQLLCFDDDGFYLGMGDGTTITPETKYKGSMAAKVPTGTCRIHFIANAKLENNAKWIGMNENTLIASLTAEDGDDMVYWGYKKCDTPEEMSTFLEGDNEVLMLRNEAKVSVTNEPKEGEDLGEDAISEIYLTVCEDLKYGTLAPFDYSNLDNPFTYDKTSNTAVTLPADTTKRTSPTDVGNDTEQFIFEASNSTKQPIKVVLKVTYQDGSVKYHQIQLRDNEYDLHKIRRNHDYQIKIQKLDKDLGYDSFEGAVNGNPSNNPSASVDDVVPEVSKDDYTLRIIGSTSVLYNEAGEKTVQFQFLGDNTMTAENFKVEWSENNGISPIESLEFTYDKDTQTGTITFPIDNVTASLQDGVILVRDTKYGLERNVHIYAVNELDFNGNIEISSVTKTDTMILTLDSESAVVVVGTRQGGWGGGGYTYSSQYISFTFSGDDDVTEDDFTITYDGDAINDYWYSPYIYSYSDGSGRIYVPVNGPSSNSGYYTGTITLTNTKYNMSRTIHIYTTRNQNNVTADLTKEAATTKTVSETTTNSYYALHFTIPDDFPDDLLPIKVKIATDQLQPVHSENQLSVVVESTKEIGQDTWNYWYVYTADKTTDERGKDKTYTVYMTPIRDDVDKGYVYLKTDYFKTQAIPVQ